MQQRNLSQTRDAIRQAAVRRQKATIDARAESFDAVRGRGGYKDVCKDAEDVWMAWGGEPGVTHEWGPVWWRDLPSSEYTSDDEHDGAHSIKSHSIQSPTASSSVDNVGEKIVQPLPTVGDDVTMVDVGTARLRARLQADARRIDTVLDNGRARAMVRVSCVLLFPRPMVAQRLAMATDTRTELRNLCHELNQTHILPNFYSFDMDSLPPPVADMCMALLMGPVRAYIPDYDPIKDA